MTQEFKPHTFSPGNVLIIPPTRMGEEFPYDRRCADVILMRMSEGQLLTPICLELRIPQSAFRRWVIDDVDGLAYRYARARYMQVEVMVDEAILIADDSKLDSWTDEEGVVHYDTNHITRDRLRVDTRKWLATKVIPHMYGDKLEVGQNFTMPRAFGAASTQDSPGTASKTARLGDEELRRQLSERGLPQHVFEE